MTAKRKPKKIVSCPSTPHFTSEMDELTQLERWEVLQNAFINCYGGAYDRWLNILGSLPEPLETIASNEFATGYRFARQQVTDAFQKDIADGKLHYKIITKIVDKLLRAEADLVDHTQPTGQPHAPND